MRVGRTSPTWPVPEPAPEPVPEPVRILVVEDHGDIAEMFVAMLTTSQHKVDTRTSGFEALVADEFDWSPYDAVVCDQHLSSSITGCRIALAARKAHVPKVVIVTAVTGVECDDIPVYLKPITGAELRQVVH